MNNKDKVKKETEGFYNYYGTVAIIVAISVSLIFLYMTSLYGFNLTDIGRLGPVGDYFGGILNPMFGLLALFALLKTIQIQSKELVKTTEQLEISADAHKEQSNSIKLQNFENTFFNMLGLHKEIVNTLSLTQQKETSDRITFFKILDERTNICANTNYTGKKVISILFEIFESYIKIKSEQVGKSTINLDKTYHNFYSEHNDIIGHYFRNIYQILKFIDKQSNEESIDKKLYTNILRAQLSNNELALILINATSRYGNKKLLPLLIKYEFMEPIPIKLIDNTYLKKIVILCILGTKKLNEEESSKYNKWKIFGKNTEWKSYINRNLKNK